MILRIPAEVSTFKQGPGRHQAPLVSDWTALVEPGNITKFQIFYNYGGLNWQRQLDGRNVPLLCVLEYFLARNQQVVTSLVHLTSPMTSHHNRRVVVLILNNSFQVSLSIASTLCLDFVDEGLNSELVVFLSVSVAGLNAISSIHGYIMRS